MNTARRPLSRRQWLGLVSAPTLVTTLGAGLVATAGPRRRVPVRRGAASGNDLRARTFNVRDGGAKGDGVALDTTAVQGQSTPPRATAAAPCSSRRPRFTSAPSKSRASHAEPCCGCETTR